MFVAFCRKCDAVLAWSDSPRLALYCTPCHVGTDPEKVVLDDSRHVHEIPNEKFPNHAELEAAHAEVLANQQAVHEAQHLRRAHAAVAKLKAGISVQAAADLHGRIEALGDPEAALEEACRVHCLLITKTTEALRSMKP